MRGGGERGGEEEQSQMYWKAELEEQQLQWIPAVEQKKVELLFTLSKSFIRPSLPWVKRWQRRGGGKEGWRGRNGKGCTRGRGCKIAQSRNNICQKRKPASEKCITMSTCYLIQHQTPSSLHSSLYTAPCSQLCLPPLFSSRLFRFNLCSQCLCSSSGPALKNKNTTQKKKAEKKVLHRTWSSSYEIPDTSVKKRSWFLTTLCSQSPVWSPV